ncbi:unnamed protein product [Vicia faba]|uniref:Uncharacterized protein n=1 Tax=Vicia faba TaxID=3906 RepID=A0AAV1AE86_VICFA|nr:unnamed protein product [Vicia faba]
MKNRISTWKGKLLSIRDRIMLINSVLNSIPIYYLSFFKIPKIVLKKLIRIQREFLWSGGLEKKGIEALWRPILEYRYGCLEGAVLGRITEELVMKSSLWWRNIVVCRSECETTYWFLNGVVCILGSRQSIKFWHNNWLGGIPFKEVFPDVFGWSNKQGSTIMQMGEFQINNWVGLVRRKVMKINTNGSKAIMARIRMVWNDIETWLGVALVDSTWVVEHMFSFHRVLGGAVKENKKLLVWLATGWVLWSMRNDIQFNSVVFHVGEVVHRAKLLSWLWNMLGIPIKVTCNFMLWSHWPIDFLNY